MKVVALGDSVRAGCAVAHHRSSVAGQLALRLADRYDATVDWQACALTGATAGRAFSLISPDALADADLVFVSVGVNDLKNLHSRRRSPPRARDTLGCDSRRRSTRPALPLGIPPLDHFPDFPRTLGRGVR